MEVLLRELRRTQDDTLEYQDREVAGIEITLGSSPSQMIQLLGEKVAPQHAVIKASGSAFRLHCLLGHRIRFNGRSVGSAKLADGDQIEVGGHRLDVIRPPAGFDIAFQITPDLEIQGSAFESAFQTQLNQALVSKRQLSWGLMAVVLLTGLVIPLYQVVNRDASTPTALDWPLDDSIWSTGPLVPAHNLAIGDNCEVCHASLFSRVADQECTACHTTVLDHVRDNSDAEANLATTRCATCHREHNLPQFMVVQNDALCTDCHAQPSSFEPELSLRAVTGFSESAHPSFDVHLLTPPVEEIGNLLSLDWYYRTSPLEGAEEQSNLTFPHDIHLDESRVQKLTDDSALGCSDCHVLSAGREHFQPVTMETHCRSCHDLRFDVAEPARELPHGEPAEVVFALEGHFMRKFGNPNADDGAIQRRRLPDRENDNNVCNEAAYDCALNRTLEEATNQFTRRGCITCHMVEQNQTLSIYDRFQVHPVRLTTDYFPISRFDHASHQTQGELTGDNACLTCHRANTSSISTDLLIPDIDNCTGCHGDVSVENRVPLNCVSCHAYHPDTHIATDAQRTDL